MSEDWVKIEVNGEQLEARKGAMLIEVTDAAGIKIPRFCYHKKLSVAANCRMCLVEVERAPKPLPACATPVMDGMKVFTHSPKALEAQQGTMEFLLINHPLDCPICDQGGECELQDVSMGYGASVSRFTERKRSVADKNIGPLVQTEMTRCIHCTRCVRFGDEIAGIRELGATGRGEDMEIGTFVEKAMVSELSGNVIDLCPVGALTSKPSRHTGRSWEYIQHAAVAPHDSVGSNLYIHTIRGRVMRIVPRDNEAVNESWLSDRDRFSYQGIYHEQRAVQPWSKAQQQTTDWAAGLEAARAGLSAVIDKHGTDAVGVLVSPTATIEEIYLLQKLARLLGIKNIDHRLRQAEFSDDEYSPVFPWLGQSLEELGQIDAALLVGSNIRMDQPLAGHRIRKAALGGARIMFINGRDYDFRFPVAAKTIAAPAAMLDALAGVAGAVADITGTAVPPSLASLLENVQADDAARAMAQSLLEAKQATLLLGNQAMAHPGLVQIRALAVFIAQASEAALGYLPEAGNSAGAYLGGALPHRQAGGKAVEKAGLDARAMLAKPLKAYILYGFEPEYDCWNSADAIQAMQGAEFVLALSAYAPASMKQYADVILPVALYAETSGTYVNAEGRWQSFQGACLPLGEARPGWKVLRVLGNAFSLGGFDYVDSAQVLDEVRKACADVRPDNLIRYAGEAKLTRLAGSGLMRISDVPIFSADGLVRRAQALQETPLAESGAVLINHQVATELGLHNVQRVEVRQNGASASLPLQLDNSIPDGCIWVAAGIDDSVGLGAMAGPAEISSA